MAHEWMLGGYIYLQVTLSVCIQVCESLHKHPTSKTGSFSSLKMNFQRRETTRLGSGMFCDPPMCASVRGLSMSFYLSLIGSISIFMNRSSLSVRLLVSLLVSLYAYLGTCFVSLSVNLYVSSFQLTFDAACEFVVFPLNSCLCKSNPVILILSPPTNVLVSRSLKNYSVTLQL